MAAEARVAHNTVLIVEDFDDTREMMRVLLEMEGCRVLEAANGQEAVEIAAQRYKELDLILMDLTMPVLDGYEATRRIRSQPETSRIPVVAVSAHCDTHWQRNALDAGCVECVSKPVDFKLIGDLLGRYLHAN